MSLSNFKDKKVLVVDDAAFMRHHVINGLQLVGITQVKEAVDGRQALAALQTGHYDLIISDWHMPQMDGIDLLRKVRADDRLHHIPFLMLTSDDTAENVNEAMLLGVSAYLVKPFRSDPLVHKVEELLSQKRR